MADLTGKTVLFARIGPKKTPSFKRIPQTGGEEGERGIQIDIARGACKHSIFQLNPKSLPILIQPNVT